MVVISLRSLLIDINIMPKIACHLNCDSATMVSDATEIMHADIMFVLKGFAQLNELERKPLDHSNKYSERKSLAWYRKE